MSHIVENDDDSIMDILQTTLARAERRLTIHRVVRAAVVTAAVGVAGVVVVKLINRNKDTTDISE